MKVHARIVIEADPEVKQMMDLMKRKTGKSMKQIVEDLIRKEYQRMENDHSECIPI